MAVPDINVLKKIPFFSNLPSQDLVAILTISAVREVASNESIFSQGDKSDGLFIILAGHFQVYINSTVKGAPPKVLVTLEPGQYVGEFGLIDGNPRSASVKSSGEGQVLYLPSSAFEFLVETHRSIGEGVVGYLCDLILKQKKLVIKSQKNDLIQTKNLMPSMHNMKVLSAIMREWNKKSAPK